MKPDFSTIKPMACKCKDIPERDNMLKWFSDRNIHVNIDNIDDTALVFDFNTTNRGGGIVLVWEILEYKVSPSDFLSKFREVYEESNKCAGKQGGISKIEIRPASKTTIVFPGKEDLQAIEAKALIASWNMYDVIEEYKLVTLQLNPHLKV